MNPGVKRLINVPTFLQGILSLLIAVSIHQDHGAQSLNRGDLSLGENLFRCLRILEWLSLQGCSSVEIKRPSKNGSWGYMALEVV